MAEVDGQVTSVERAVRLLSGASRTVVVSEVLDNKASAPFHAHRAQRRAHIERRLAQGIDGWQAVQEAAALPRRSASSRPVSYTASWAAWASGTTTKRLPRF